MATPTLTGGAPPPGVEDDAHAELEPRPGRRSRLDAVFGADLRSLAAFRIALALVVLIDLGGRALDLTAHYTDAGVLPRADLVGPAGAVGHWVLSVNVIDGGTLFQGVVFAAAALAAIAMLVGWYTRLATIVLWVLVVSIEWRNPLLVGGGEILLRLLLFWAMFLPLAEWWSVDSARRRTREPRATRVVSVPSAALFLQIALVYWFAVLLKAGPEWRFDGTAIYYALGVDQLATPLGHFLWELPDLLTVLTFGVLALEAFGPILLLSPFFTAQARVIGVALFMSLHLGIWLTLGMGIFPFVAGLCMVCFLPGELWDRWARSRSRPGGGPAAIRTPRAVNVVAAVALAYVLLWNITTVTGLELPKLAERAGRVVGLSQRWDMFAPSPLKDDGWYVVPGTLSDGRRVDVAGVLRGDQRLRPVSWERPESIRSTYRSERWRKYLEEVRKNYPAQQPNLGRYICRTWNSRHVGADALVQYQIVYMGDETLPDNRLGPPRLRILWVDNCA
jgi:hypothetical protein